MRSWEEEKKSSLEERGGELGVANFWARREGDLFRFGYLPHAYVLLFAQRPRTKPTVFPSCLTSWRIIMTKLHVKEGEMLVFIRKPALLRALYHISLRVQLAHELVSMDSPQDSHPLTERDKRLLHLYGKIPTTGHLSHHQLEVL